MVGPWEKYAQPATDGPWSKYSSQPEVVEPSALDRIGRVAGLGARAVAKNVAAVPALMADATSEIINAGLEGANKLGIPVDYRMQRPSAVLDRTLTQAGLPQPETGVERFSSDVTGAMTGQGAFIGAGRALAGAAGPVASRVGQTLAANPGGQLVAAATGTGAADITREQGGGTAAQIAAGLAGAATPSVIQAGGEAALRGMLRGGEAGRTRTAANIKSFRDAGTTPTVGQATENRGARLTETLLSKTPGSAGVMADKARTQASEIGAKVENLAEDLSPRATSTKAGAAIEKGTAKFVDEFRAQQGFLYSKLDKYIAKDRPVDMTSTANKLEELNRDIPGAPALSKFFKNGTIQAIESAMKSDTADLTTRLPYEALKKLRTLVGSEMENTSLISSVPRSKWSALYAAMSDDLQQAAKEAGPEAQKAFARANTYTRAGHERIGLYLDRVAGKDTVEKVFQAAINPSEIREGASTVNAVLRSLDPPARDTVRAAFLKRLGVAQPGRQDATGEVFSTETFLTNWNKISPEAKMTLFADAKGTLRSDLDQIAKAAANLREGSKVFANPSGTEAALSTRLGISGILLSAMLGHPGVAASIGGGMAAANVGARNLMTNPDFVGWLAKSTKMGSGMLPAQLNTLAQIAERQDPETAQAMLDYAASVKTGAAGR